MKEQILFEKTHGVSSLKEAWEKYRKRVVISIAVQTMTSLSGVNVSVMCLLVVFYLLTYIQVISGYITI